MRAKVVIVGGGIMGTAIAVELARVLDPLRDPIVLFERSHVGAGSTGRSGAILRTHYADRAVAAMARDSLRSYASFEARSGRAIGFRRCGCLTLAGPAQRDWIARIERSVAMQRELGIRTEILRSEALRALLPGIEVASGTLGAWEPDSGFVDPVRTVEAFAALARVYGATTRIGVEVSEILVRGGRAIGVRTPAGDVDAESVVAVAGPWSGGLLARAGVDLPLKILRPENHFLAIRGKPIDAIGGPALEDPASHAPMDRGPCGEAWSAWTDETREESVRGLHPVLIDLEHGFYCRCDPDRRAARVGAIEYARDAELATPEPFAEEIDDATKLWARTALARRVPEYADAPDAGSIAGWYTLTPDAQAVIGPAPGVAGLLVVTGFSGHGFKLAPSVGEGVRQMVLGEPVSAFDAGFFSPARFVGAHDWSGAFGL